jgi:hypothetical protein
MLKDLAFQVQLIMTKGGRETNLQNLIVQELIHLSIDLHEEPTTLNGHTRLYHDWSTTMLHYFLYKWTQLAITNPIPWLPIWINTIDFTFIWNNKSLPITKNPILMFFCKI